MMIHVGLCIGVSNQPRDRKGTSLTSNQNLKPHEWRKSCICARTWGRKAQERDARHSKGPSQINASKLHFTRDSKPTSILIIVYRRT